MTDVARLGLSEAVQQTMAERAAAVQNLELDRAARTATIPTDDAQMKRWLRAMKEPICIFGERPPERSDRLKRLVALYGVPDAIQQELDQAAALAAKAKVFEPNTEVFYTVGTPALKSLREVVADDSLARATQRLEWQHRVGESATKAAGFQRACRAVVTDWRQVVNDHVWYDDRALTSVACVAPNTIVTTSVDPGSVKVWRVGAAGDDGHISDTSLQTLPRAHGERVTCVAASPDGSVVVTTSRDGTACLYTGRDWDVSHDVSGLDVDVEEGEMTQLRGHAAAVHRAAVHPTNLALVTTSADYTWRLWDTTTAECLAVQEGHGAEVYPVAFHPDGSLVTTGDASGAVFVWDCRTGKKVWSASVEHSTGVVSAAWSPNGVTMATAAESIVALWDVRKGELFRRLAAHSKVISAVQFDPIVGASLLTAGFDGAVKVWNAAQGTLVKTLDAHRGPVTGLCRVWGEAGHGVRPSSSSAAASYGLQYVSVGHDRSCRLWALPPDTPPSVVLAEAFGTAAVQPSTTVAPSAAVSAPTPPPEATDPPALAPHSAPTTPPPANCDIDAEEEGEEDDFLGDLRA